MDLRQQLADDIKAAMKARAAERLSALRMLRSAVLNKDKAGAEPATDAELIAVIRSLIKQRRDSETAFREAGRVETADKEAAEAAMLQAYLPAAPSEADMAAWVTAAIAESGATSPKEMGKVMGRLKAKASEGADMGQLSALVKKRLMST